jgi:cysteinyl-tRNA synthetase
MAVHFLGVPVDVHSGGADLLFPHHESEIAQAEGATDLRPFVRYWVHTAMVRHEGEKMSKSLGNLVMVDDLLEEWTPDTLRLYLASHHYRDAWSHNVEEIRQAAELSEKLKSAASVWDGQSEPLDAAPQRAAFLDAMDDDLNTPTAIIHLELLAEAILEAAGDGRSVAAAQETLTSLGQILGLRLNAQEPEETVVERWSEYLDDFAQ